MRDGERRWIDEEDKGDRGTKESSASVRLCFRTGGVLESRKKISLFSSLFFLRLGMNAWRKVDFFVQE